VDITLKRGKSRHRIVVKIELMLIDQPQHRLGGQPEAVDCSQKLRRDGVAFDAAAMRGEALDCRAWLVRELARPHDCAATVVVTHFAPSAVSADPRFGQQPSTASFCNRDDDLIVQCDLWLHGHVHSCHDYTLARPGGTPTRVVCNARGLADKHEGEGFDPLCVIEV